MFRHIKFRKSMQGYPSYIIDISMDNGKTWINGCPDMFLDEYRIWLRIRHIQETNGSKVAEENRIRREVKQKTQSN